MTWLMFFEVVPRDFLLDVVVFDVMPKADGLLDLLSGPLASSMTAMRGKSEIWVALMLADCFAV